MSSEDLALFLREKMGEQRVTNTEMVRRTSISRRTWYRLLSADIEEAKLSTLVKLANALNVSVAELVQIYFSRRPAVSRVVKEAIVETNLPNNSLVSSGGVFIKTWLVKNKTNECWKGLSLKCIDEDLPIQVRSVKGSCMIPTQTLNPEMYEIVIPDTNIGSVANISLTFTAPEQLGSTVSHWRFSRKGQLLEDQNVPKLSCLVKVV
jgi:transcriptional regulator with XRE-family HTH domain